MNERHGLARRIGTVAVLALTALLLLVTLLSAVPSNQWWLRIWDFPRSQILGLMVLALVLVWLVPPRRWRILALPLVLAIGWQAYRIHPFTPLVRPEIAFADAQSAPDASCFTVLSLNVLQDNRDFARTAALLRRTDPDMLLLLETDAAWERAMAPVLARYPQRLSRPIDNTYGLIFATRLPVEDARIENIAEEDTPSVTAIVTAGDERFRMLGLHPRPPHPGQDTEERDAEIAIAARLAAETKLPVLAFGDFNDVAWSHTSRLFKRIGGYLDPRVGRGTYATFPAGWPMLGWPLDHLFVTPEFLVRDLAVLEDVGSDHLPIHAEVCLVPASGKARNAAPDAATAADREAAGEIMQEYREDKAEERAGED
jgi:endonuclease/exonuclease/phosphatase (EEP) superfamily protein YafD